MQILPRTRALSLGPSDGARTIVFVSTNDAGDGSGRITALTDLGSNGSADTACTLYNSPIGELTQGIHFDPSTDVLYVAERTRIIKLNKAGTAADNGCMPGPLQAIKLHDIPVQAQNSSHGRRSLSLGPDGLLYFAVAAPFNVAPCELPLCTLHRMATNGSNVEVYAEGLRNAAALAVDPRTGAMWAAEMGRDSLWATDASTGTSFSNNAPDDQLYHIPRQGMNFQFPYCHWQGAGDPTLRLPGSGYPLVDDTFNPPGAEEPENKTLASWNTTFAPYCISEAPLAAQALGPHVASLGVTFYDPPRVAGVNVTNPWPPEWSGDGAMFVAEHGSWNRIDAIGYRVVFLRATPDGQVLEHKVFASGWLQGRVRAEQWYWGRPVDVFVLPDGSLLVTDDDSAMGGAIYRIFYDPNASVASSAVGLAWGPWVTCMLVVSWMAGFDFGLF